MYKKLKTKNIYSYINIYVSTCSIKNNVVYGTYIIMIVIYNDAKTCRYR